MTESELKIKITNLSESRISIELNVSEKLCKSSYSASLSRLSRTVNLPGFRPGKVPKQVIIQQVGIDKIKAAALEAIVDKAWKDAVSQESIEPLSEAKLKEDLQSLVNRFNPNEGITFTIETEVAVEKNNESPKQL